MKRSPLKRKTPMKRGGGNLKRSPLKKVSDRRKRESAIYSQRKNEYFQNLAQEQGSTHALCEVCIAEGNKNPKLAQDWHHVLPIGRGGSLNQSEDLMVALCRTCHNNIHDNMKWAEENGWLVRG